MPSSKVLMGQVSGEFDHNPPNVRSWCILAKLYKVKKHLDQREEKIVKEKQKREKNHPIVPSSSDWTRGQTLSQFSSYFLLKRLVNFQAISY